MKHPIDLEHWNRKEHFLFFGSMDDPFFGLTTQIDVTSIYKEAKADHASFFLYSLQPLMRWKSSGTGSSTTSLSASTESTWEQRLGEKTEHSASASSNIHRTGNCSFKTHRKRSNVCKLSQAFAKIGNLTGKT
jgi:hypothetical protein